MPIPYAFLKVLNGEKVPVLDREERDIQEQTCYLLKGENMKGEYLGACLDSARWGSMTTVLYEMNVKELINFVKTWMEQNKDNFQNMFHERRIGELYTKFELPYINHKVCPTNKDHEGKVTDLEGLTRCANKTEIRKRSSFVETYESFDRNAKMKKTHYIESPPTDTLPDDAWDYRGNLDPLWKNEYDFYQKELRLFEEEEPTLIAIDRCYAILSDKGIILPLETILKRLNLMSESETVYCPGNGRSEPYGVYGCTKQRLAKMTEEEREIYSDGIASCPGHPEPAKHSEFPFDGWDMAFYVQRWWEQDPGKAPLFSETK